MIDQHEHIKVNFDTREFEWPDEPFVVAVKGDTHSQVLTFDIPRYYDGNDLYDPNVTLRIHVSKGVSPDTTGGDPDTPKFPTDHDEKIVQYTWILDPTNTDMSGQVKFYFEFIATQTHPETGEETILYTLNTRPGSFQVYDNTLN